MPTIYIQNLMFYQKTNFFYKAAVKITKRKRQTTRLTPDRKPAILSFPEYIKLSPNRHTHLLDHLYTINFLKCYLLRTLLNSNK